MEQLTAQTDGKKAKRMKTIVGAITAAAVVLAVNFATKKPSIANQLSQMASEINKNCPTIIDKETQLDNVSAMPDKGIQYTYTLVNMEKTTTDTIALKNYITPIATNNVKTRPDMKFLRENKVTFIYYYRDKKGSYLFSFSIPPTLYED